MGGRIFLSACAVTASLMTGFLAGGADEVSGGLPGLAARLSAPGWNERQAAREELVKGGLEGRFGAPAMVGEYLKTADPEARALLMEAIGEVAKATLFKEKKGFLGIQLEDSREPVMIDGKRYMPIHIVSALDEQPAKKAGVKDDSLILRLDGNVCDGKFNTADFVEYVGQKHPGDIVTLELCSDGRIESRPITLGERPEDNMAPSIEYRKAEFFRRWFDREISKALRSKDAAR